MHHSSEAAWDREQQWDTLPHDSNRGVVHEYYAESLTSVGQSLDTAPSFYLDR